jgi:hypothetical protein
MGHQHVLSRICEEIDRENKRGLRAVRLHPQLQLAIVAEWAVDYSVDGEMHVRGVPLVGDERVQFGDYELDFA